MAENGYPYLRLEKGENGIRKHGCMCDPKTADIIFFFFLKKINNLYLQGLNAVHYPIYKTSPH
jgi:hypothetical protein